MLRIDPESDGEQEEEICFTSVPGYGHTPKGVYLCRVDR